MTDTPAAPYDKRLAKELRALFDKTAEAFSCSSVDYPDRVNIALIEVYAYGRRKARVSDTAENEGYPGIAHDLETMRSALKDLLEQVESLDSYGLTRDTETYKAQACWDDAIYRAAEALKRVPAWQPHPAPSAGCVSVPMEPTREMIAAGAHSIHDEQNNYTKATAAYYAMLAAAPVSPAPNTAKRICLDEDTKNGGTGVRCDTQCSACQDEDVLKHGSNVYQLPPFEREGK